MKWRRGGRGQVGGVDGEWGGDVKEEKESRQSLERMWCVEVVVMVKKKKLVPVRRGVPRIGSVVERGGWAGKAEARGDAVCV